MLISDMYKMQDLRKKILFTVLILVVTRIGTVIPVPGINPTILREFYANSSNSNVGLVEYLNFFSGGAFSQFSLFTLGVMPYISMQIILQLMMLIIPKLKKWSEDSDGRKKIQKINRYGTIVVCIIQSLVVTIYAKSIQQNGFPVITIDNYLIFTITTIIAVTTGTMTLVWFGEKITQNGVGNGISLLIFAGIVARIPDGITQLVQSISSGLLSVVALISILVMFVVVVVLIVYEQEGERRIPVNYSKRVIGRKMYGSQSSYIPFKINPSGVIPVIFASAILSFPLQIAGLLSAKWLNDFANWLDPQRAPYIIIYSVLIIAFAFFYTQVSLNPTEMAKQIKDNGGAIPGVRAEQVEAYLKKVLNRIVLPGSLFLAFIALIPTFIQLIFGLPPAVAMLFGGTSLIILVGCDLELMRQIESIMKMHHHPGFLGVKSIKNKRVKTRNL